MRQSQPTAQAEGLERRDAATSILKFHNLAPAHPAMRACF